MFAARRSNGTAQEDRSRMMDRQEIETAAYYKTYAIEEERPQGADISVCEIR